MGRAPGDGVKLDLRVLGGRLGAQWERERRDTLFLMGAVLLAFLPHAATLPWWATTGFAMLFVWRLGLVISGRWLPRASVRWVAAIACAAAVYAHFGTLIGRDAGVALLALFLGLKLMEMRARRDLFIVIFLCMFLQTTAFLESQSLFTAALTVAGTVALIASMLTMQFGPTEVPVARRLRMAGSIVLQALPVAAVLFVVFPRATQPLWGAPTEAPGARTGLSGSMTPGSISNLAASQEIALRARFEGGTPLPASVYFRGPVFGHYDGLTWRPLPNRIGPPPPVPSPQDVDRALAAAPQEVLRYTVTLEPTDQPWLPILEGTLRLEAPIAGRIDPEGVARVVLPVTQRIRYAGIGLAGRPEGLAETRLSLQNWVDLPAGFNPRTLQLAMEWRAETTARGLDPAAAARALVERAIAWIREEDFRYTMRPPLLGRHAVDEFLFDVRRGFCEHYAGAFVVLMRALDIPARVITGYHGGEINPVDGYLVVREADAHAWVEVWLAEQGWVRVDPTAAIPLTRVERGSQVWRRSGALAGEDAVAGLGTRLRLRVEALSNAWNQWVLSYDQGRQQRLFARFGLAIDGWAQFAGLVAVVLVALIGAVALVTLRPRLAADPLARELDRFCDRLAQQTGLIRAPHETALRYLGRVERMLEPERIVEARRIVARYNALRYGAGADDARSGVRDLRRWITAFKS